MPATTKKPIKIVPNTIKTIPKVPLSPISKSKSFQEKLNDIQNNIDINIDDIPEDLLDIWDELQEDITPKLVSKNYKLWLTIFTPFILPGIINGMLGKPSVPQPVVTVQEPAPDPKQIVNFAQKYFAEHGLELCKSLTKTDLNNIKQDLINNWGKGPDAFSKAFQDSYPVSKARLENIYRSERHLAEYNGVLERAKIADHKYKQWRAVGDERSCDLCMSHDMETVPIEEPFSNGEMTATGHPQCRCSMVTYSDEDYNEMKENSSYLADAFETMKLNYNCPDDEKIGSGPGSCSGGNTSNLDKVSTLKNKIRELEKSVSEGKSTFDEAYEQYKSIQKELDLELEKEKLRNPDNAKITNDIVTDPEPITPYKALSDYQNYAYTAINDYLRKTNYVKQNPQQTKNIQNMIKTIDSEMENNTLKSDKLVFRADNAGISSDAFEKTGLTNIFKDTFGKESLTLEDFIKNHKLIDKIREKLVGYEYTEKAYLSTGSDKENTMNRFLAPSRDISKYGVTGLINLIVPKGTPAIRIADYTGLEDELGGKIDEYLIGRDQTIVIDQVYIRPADDDRLYLEYNAHIKTNEQKQNSEYLEDVTNFIKLNYNCPDSEKQGTGPGSCGGSKPNSDPESFSDNNNHIESYSRVLQSKVPKKFSNQVYLVRMGSEKEDRHNITGNVFVGNDINMLIKKALESSKESGNLIIGRCSKDAFEDDELDKISKNNFITTSKYLGQSFSPVDVVIDTGTSDTIYKRSKDELEKEKNLFDTHELQLNKIEQNTALSNYRNFGYQSINNILRKNYVIEGESKKSALDPTPVYSKEYIDKALKDASLISDAMEPSKENKTLSRVDGAAITATLFPVAGITEELTNYFKKTYEKSSKYPKAEDILFDNIKPPSEKTWNNYLTTKLKDLEFKDPAFLSTSKSESGIKEDLLNSSNELSPYGIPSLLKIEVPKGTRLVDMQERLGIGEGRYKTEKEVLLDKNTIFKIKSVKLEPHDNGIIARIMVRAIQKLPEPIKENSASNNILVYFENNPIRLMDTDYLSDAFETIKQNYKCKAGTVDDSNKCELENSDVPETRVFYEENIKSKILSLNDSKYPKDAVFRSKSRSNMTKNVELDILNNDNHVKILSDNIDRLHYQCDNLKIPRLRGIVADKNTKAGLASMADGILAVTPDMFRNDPDSEVDLRLSRNQERLNYINNKINSLESFIQSDKEKWTKNNKSLVESGMKFEESTFYKTGYPWPKEINEYKSEKNNIMARINDLNTKKTNALIYTWKPGMPDSEKPFGASEYFPFEQSPKLLLDHEFGHHIHQLYGVKNAKSYAEPPLEKKIDQIYKKSEKDGTLIVPSKYAASDHQEWFAESYSLYVNGRDDLVTPGLIDLFKKIGVKT